MRAQWVAHDIRDQVVDFVRRWGEKIGQPQRRFAQWLGISRSKFYDWAQRYGKVNEHNAWIPRDFWLEAWEEAAIRQYAGAHRRDGYRRLAFMMLDEDVVAVSPSRVYRVLKDAGMLRVGC